MSTRRATALVGALVLALAACGGGGGDGDFGTVDEDGNVSIDGVNRLDDGELTVCSDLPYPPFEWENDSYSTSFDLTGRRRYATCSSCDRALRARPTTRRTRFLTSPRPLRSPR